MVSGSRIRLIDTAGSELGIVDWTADSVDEGDTALLPDGRAVQIIEVYDDEFGREGGVLATVVVDDE